VNVIVQKTFKQYIVKLENDDDFLIRYAMERFFSEDEDANEIFEL